MGRTLEGSYELHWRELEYGIKRYTLFQRLPGGQIALVDSMEQGPFDTALEVAQWAIKRITVGIPPSAS